MLEKLGKALKKAQNKIANAIFLDKNLVDGIVRELQRALIEADVKIMLVKQLTDKIKKAAFDERIKEIEKKEHLIKLLHDELIAILGESKKLELNEKKQTKIMLLGLYGAGKCVHEKSNIQLSDGETIEAKHLYERYNKKRNERKLEDGKIIDISNENLLIPSYNPLTQKIENKKATHLWKLKKQELIEIKLDNGNDYSIKVTPEHPFFVLRNGQVIQIRADQITEQDIISIPNEIKIKGETINLFNQLKKFDLDIYLPIEDIKKHLPKNKTIKEICKNLSHKRNYIHLTKSLKNGKIPLELIKSDEYNFLKLKDQKAKKIITFPLFLTSEFAEFLGYVIGDGHLEKSYIEITNKDNEIIERTMELSKSLFNINPCIKKDERSQELHKIQLCSKTLVELFKIFGLTPGKKGKQLKVPKQIMLSSNETVRQFLKAYFDCDSYPSKNKRFIELTSESQILIQQINFLLRRFSILSSISKKIINKIPYWRLYIKARYAENYSEKIGYIIKNKQEKVKEYRQIGILQGSGNQDMIILGKILKALRLQLGFSIGEIQTNAIYSYNIHEQKGTISKEKLQKLILYYKLKKQGIFWNFLKDLSKRINMEEKYPHNLINGICKHLKNEGFIKINNNQILISKKGQKYLQIIKQNQKQVNLIINNLELIAQSNICWIPVKETKEIKNDKKYVYDLTVKDNHSFIAEGFIIHNTTTIAKLGNYYQKRGKKVALVGLDVHRPAAKEQLMQLAEKNNLKVFVDLKETNALKTFKKFEKDLKKFDLILIDTAGRHTLNKELIKEIKDLGKTIKPDETILVMPADIGQAAKKQAKEFQDALKISGVIITRMDSSAKAGGALTACAEVKAGVYFITTGEKINDLEYFEPKRFLSRLLGMGDLETLIEKIKSVTDEKQQGKIQKKLQEGKLSLEDVIEQVKSMSAMGGFDKLKNLIPGMGKAKIDDDKLGAQEDKVKKWQHIIKSMTQEEKENPEILQKQTSRIARVAKGAGVNTSDIRSLLKQYDMLQSFVKDSSEMDMSKGMSQKQMQRLMKKFGKKKLMRFK